MILTHVCDRCTLPIEQGKEYTEYVIVCGPIRMTKVVKAFSDEDVAERHKKHPAAYMVHETTDVCLDKFKMAIAGLMNWTAKRNS